jgi:hypothetical protein
VAAALAELTANPKARILAVVAPRDRLKQRIFSRRARFVAAALAGVATAAGSCGGEVEVPPDEAASSTSSGSVSSGGGAQVCLSMPAGGEAGAQPCLAPRQVGGGGAGNAGGAGGSGGD